MKPPLKSFGTKDEVRTTLLDKVPANERDRLKRIIKLEEPDGGELVVCEDL
jgi:hypothetical protein